MANGKSPGSDGLPAEFYKDFFPHFGPWFINIANAQLAKSLSSSQRLGIITLLPKKDSDKCLLSNWRPVSLLNTDYKIISKTLVNRLKKLANRIIGNSQNSAVPGRSIYDTLHLLRNVFDYCKDRDFPCLAVSLDQAKAFDKVHHIYYSIMEQMGIGPIFLSMVRQLYNDIYSKVLVNGFLTVAFKITGSVRQGCGLSPLLFNIAIEPLILKHHAIPPLSWGSHPRYARRKKGLSVLRTTLLYWHRTNSLSESLFHSSRYTVRHRGRK
jgi:hypothetical protein